MVGEGGEMKEVFTVKNIPNGKAVKQNGIINDVLESYRLEGFTLTLRQLYYQLVSRDIIPNTDKEYKKLSRVVTQGRLIGLIDWDDIEDRLRVANIPYYVKGIKDAMYDTINQYRLNRQQGQPRHIDVWIEKDALSNIFAPLTDYYHVHLLVNRGCSSISAMYVAAKRMRGTSPVILYFGDHDPSELDMVRDIRERLETFKVYADVIPVALTMEQIERHTPPPNPAKVTDPRAENYFKKFGKISWELDVLPSDVLQKLVREQIIQYMDRELFEQTKKGKGRHYGIGKGGEKWIKV